MPVGMISHYRIVRRLGAGGMGEVFLAEDIRLERGVALKLLPQEVAKDASRRKRFLTEAKAASALNHPNVCTIYQVGETADGQPFIAMEYLEGQTLDVLASRRRLALGELVAIGLQVAEALEAARQHQLVHRDIKPSNIMLDAHGRVKVLDFGLARRLDRPGDASTLTMEGAILGTPNYLSPELALGREVDCRADIFSLGVVLYELAAGRNPFAGASFGDLVNNILNHEPAPLRPWNPNVTPEFERVVRQCLEKDPAKRYATPAHLREDLAKLQAGLHTPRASSRTVPTLAAVVVALTVIGLGAVWLVRSRPPVRSTAPATNTAATGPQKSVAVLPFVNMSSDKNDEYLSDGMTEELVNALTKVKGLRVPGRSSSFAFKNQTGKDIFRSVGEQLHVGAVLEGSVRKAGNQLRITAQLISVADGFHLWSDTFDRDMTNIFAIQSDIASRVAEALKVQLLGGVPEPTRNIEAYQLYLRGRYQWNRRTPEHIQQAIECFNQAVAKDPAYALACAGLADCYVILSDYAGLPGRETFPRARAAALKALELDSSLAEPHAALANIQANFGWDWSGAEAGFRRAIALNPNYATAHHWFANVLLALHRYDEALTEFKQAQEIDPLSPVINVNVAYTLYATGNTNSAIEVLRKQIALDPLFVVAHQTLGWIYLDTGMLSEAIAEFETMRRLDGSGVYGLADLGFACARAGRTNEAQKILGRLQDLHRQGFDYRGNIALVQHALGEDEAALTSLEQALAERAPSVGWINFDPYCRDLRKHPRAQAILRKMNLVN